MEQTPSLAKVRAAARRHGLDVRTSRKGTDRLWLVHTESGKLRSPKQGVSLDDLWNLVALPESDPRAESVWKGHGED